MADEIFPLAYKNFSFSFCNLIGQIGMAVTPLVVEAMGI